MKKILVTGGTGFIGRNIAESFLRDKYELFTPKRTELDCADEDSVATYFAKQDFDVIIHSAAMPGHRNAANTNGLLYTNARMMQLLLQQQNHWGKLLNMGSGAIYDMRHYQPKMKESYFGTHIPVDEHGFNKYIFGKLLPGLEHVYDFRIFGIYGKYEDYAIRFISNAICKAIYNFPITLRQNRKFDYLYIDDLMPILAHFIENDPAQKMFNITPDKSIGLLELANIVNDISGKNLEILVSMEVMGVEYSGDNTALRNEYKAVKFTDVRQGVGALYRWYEDNKTNINKQLLVTDKA